ncbi:unnamed protein product [Rotaria sp. Silwood1]|nr:unnamed protein product [Rotaria sp. Silwood1]
MMSCERQLSDLRILVNDLYSLGNTIGRGHFAVVKIARHVFTQKEVAVKVIDKTKLDEISKTHLLQEVKCMKLVQHPNVVRLYEVIDTPNKLHLILELADGGDMYDYISKHANGLNESLARRYFRQICRALKYCHEMYVCHRDLKPENLVFFEKQGVVKLTDFGFSNLFSPGKKLLTSCGSLAYSAPEILLGDPYDAPAVDIWSLGVILFMLVTGHAPFQEANDSETVMMILDCSYKVPPNISLECQNLIHRMIVREPEKRATLDEVMFDIWYRLCDNDDNDNDNEQYHIDPLKLIPQDDHEFVLRQMIDGNIAGKETILESLNNKQYNHITATYYLLAEKFLHNKFDNENRTVKRQKCSLQPAYDPFKEQTNVLISSTLHFNFTDVSLPTSRRNSMDEDFDDVFGKEYKPPILMTPKHSIDSVNEQILSALVEDDEELLLLQQCTTSTNIPTTPAQAMKIILEEDENPESPLTDVTDTNIQQVINLPTVNKIVDNEDEADNSSISNPTAYIGNSTTTSSILRSKELHSVIETKRRNLSRSCSSSDSEDNGSNYDINRLTNQKHIRSPNFLSESEFINNYRGRSLSNIEHSSHEIPTNIQQQIVLSNNSENMKRKSFSRTTSIISTNRFALINTNDDMNTDTSITSSSTLINHRTRSLSSEHRLANPSQISIASRTSIRHSTPRESTVFTKTDVPNFIRVLQQKQHQDTNDAIHNSNENHRVQLTSLHQEHIQTPIIVEEDTASPLISKPSRNIQSPIITIDSNDATKFNVIIPTIEYVNLENGHILSSPRSLLSTLKYSLIKHQQDQRKPNIENSINIDGKQKDLTNKQRVCCIIL